MQTTSVQHPRKTYSWAVHGPVRTVAFFPDGKRIATGGHLDSSVRVWDIDTGNEDGEPLLKHTLPTLSVAVSKRGLHVVTGGSDNKVFLWDVNNRQAARVLFSSSLTGQILSVAFNSTSTFPMLVASSGSDGVVNIWKVKPDMYSTPIKRIAIENTMVSSIQFSLGDPNLIAVTSLDKKARIYDAYSGEVKAIFDGRKNVISSLTWFPDDQRLASGGDKTVRIWDSRSEGSNEELLMGHTQLVKSVAISPQGRFIASGSNDRTVRFWNAVTRVQIGSPITHPGPVNLVAFSPNGKSLVSVTENGEAHLWDTDYLEIEEGLQLTKRVIDGLVSSSSDMQMELHKVLGYEFNTIRQEHARGIAEQRQLFENKIAKDDRRFSELQDALNKVKESQDTQLVTLSEALQEVTTRQDTQYGALKKAIKDLTAKQETDVQALQGDIERIMDKHDGQFQQLKSSRNANFEELRTDLRSLQRAITDLGNLMKKPSSTARGN